MTERNALIENYFSSEENIRFVKIAKEVLKRNFANASPPKGVSRSISFENAGLSLHFTNDLKNRTLTLQILNGKVDQSIKRGELIEREDGKVYSPITALEQREAQEIESAGGQSVESYRQNATMQLLDSIEQLLGLTPEKPNPNH